MNLFKVKHIIFTTWTRTKEYLTYKYLILQILRFVLCLLWFVVKTAITFKSLSWLQCLERFILLGSLHQMSQTWIQFYSNIIWLAQHHILVFPYTSHYLHDTITQWRDGEQHGIRPSGTSGTLWHRIHHRIQFTDTTYSIHEPEVRNMFCLLLSMKVCIAPQRCDNLTVRQCLKVWQYDSDLVKERDSLTF